MRDDLKAAFRSLVAAKTFTVVALVVLTLGIGATTAIFSVVDAVVLRALPFDEHDRLVAVGERRPAGPIADPYRDPLQLSSSAPQNYLDWVSQQQVFASMAAIAGGAITLQDPGGEPEELRSQRVTAAFFDVLRTHPAIGRAFTADAEVDGRHRVAVLSDRFWRRRFAADPGVIGRTIPLDAGAFEVIGIMPPEFAYPVGVARPTDLWIPYVVPESERVRGRGYSIYLQTIARLKPGVTVAQAQSQMDQVAQSLQTAYPDWNRNVMFGVRPLIDHLLGARTRSWLLLLLGAVGLVLLIACANVANLLLARATVREREIGIRAALGAGRWRLVRQLLAESLMLSAIGTICSVVLAWWAIGLLKNAMPEGVPRVEQIAIDLRVLAAAVALSLVTGVAFGIVPALQMSRPDLTQSLKEGARGSGGAGRRRLRAALVVTEIAVAVVLLVGAALFIGSFAALMRIDPGFNPENVLTVLVSPRWEPGKGGPDMTAQFVEIVERIEQTPGVVSASFIQGGMPLGGSMSSTGMTVPGRTIDGSTSISIRNVTPDYHKTLRIPLRMGRYFEKTDRKGTPNVVMLNDAAAKRWFPGENAVGKTVSLHGTPEATVVGVVGDVHQTSLETDPVAEVYIPLAQARVGAGELLVRTGDDPYRVLPAVKAAVLGVMPNVPLRGVRTMEELISRRTAQRRLNMLLLGLFGVLGLVIAAVGIYGVLAYVVAQRTREIGVRMALGATRSAVISMVLRSAAVMVVAGLVIGGGVAWYLSATAKAFLFRLEATDPRAFAAAIVTLAVAALVASALPARRAASVDPMTALRE